MARGGTGGGNLGSSQGSCDSRRTRVTKLFLARQAAALAQMRPWENPAADLKLFIVKGDITAVDFPLHDTSGQPGKMFKKGNAANGKDNNVRTGERAKQAMKQPAVSKSMHEPMPLSAVAICQSKLGIKPDLLEDPLDLRTRPLVACCSAGGIVHV